MHKHARTRTFCVQARASHVRSTLSRCGPLNAAVFQQVVVVPGFVALGVLKHHKNIVHVNLSETLWDDALFYICFIIVLVSGVLCHWFVCLTPIQPNPKPQTRKPYTPTPNPEPKT